MEDQQCVFYANMCSVCYVTVKEANLKKCSACKAVSYCSDSHQKRHWKAHKQLCGVIQQVDKSLIPENLDVQANWYKYRINFLVLCEFVLKRKLNLSEVNTILFPNNCQICHTTSDLTPCEECLCVSYCSADHKLVDLNKHDQTCSSLKLCVQLDLYLVKHKVHPEYVFCDQDINLTSDIKQFIQTFIKVVNPVDELLQLQNALISDLITCPLSILYALTLLNFILKEKTVLHIVGSGILEIADLQSWEVILEIQNNVKELEIHFIGPELVHDEPYVEYSSQLKFKFFTQMYHDFVNTTEYQKPDLICTFNCGFHEFQNSDSDTWIHSLPLLIENKNLPLVITSFTDREAEQDIARLTSINSGLKIREEVNPFASLRPYRDFENLGVYFNNKYVSVVMNE